MRLPEDIEEMEEMMTQGNSCQADPETCLDCRNRFECYGDISNKEILEKGDAQWEGQESKIR